MVVIMIEGVFSVGFVVGVFFVKVGVVIRIVVVVSS